MFCVQVQTDGGQPGAEMASLTPRRSPRPFQPERWSSRQPERWSSRQRLRICALSFPRWVATIAAMHRRSVRCGLDRFGEQFQRRPIMRVCVSLQQLECCNSSSGIIQLGRQS